MKEAKGKLPSHSALGRLSRLGVGKKLALAVAVLILGALMVLFGGAEREETEERDALEAQLEEMCSSLSGVGSCRVMITYKVTEGRYGSSGTKTVESVAVVCKGADKVGVRRELTEMMTALFGIGANRIYVSKMK